MMKSQRQFWHILFFLCLCLVAGSVRAQGRNPCPGLVIGRVHYSGGGDWYNDPSAIPNLATFIKKHTNVAIEEREKRLTMLDETLFSHPVLFLTGHGRIKFGLKERERLRAYLLLGGFLYVDDDYGLDESFRTVMKKVFPEKELLELPFSHEIYHNHFTFAGGPPKIHKHDNQSPRGFGMFDDKGRLMLYYTFETSISDGWSDSGLNGDAEDVREKALRMGTNIIVYALTH